MPTWMLVVSAWPAAVVVFIIATRHRQGLLTAASRLVVFGAVILALEHAGFAISCSAEALCPVEGTLFFGDHVRLHFFMAGAYTVIGSGALIVVARALLRDGKRSGWFTILGALGVGGTLDLVLGSAWFDHGFPGNTTAAAELIEDFGWTFLYTYLFAWSAALVISYGPVFRQTTRPGEQRTDTARRIE